MNTIFFSKMSIAQRFLLTSLSIITAIVVGVIIYMINDSLSGINSQLKSLTVGRSSSVIEKIDRDFYERFGDVQAFAYNQLARECVHQDSSNREIQNFMNTMTGYYVLYDLMMICNSDGIVLAAI